MTDQKRKQQDKMEIQSNTAVGQQPKLFKIQRGVEFKDIRNNTQEFPIKKVNTISDIDAKKTKLLKSAQGFEAIFIRKLFSTMRSTMSENSMFGTGVAGDIYGDIIDNAVSDVMSKQSVLGLADMLYSTMVKSLETRGDEEPESGRRTISILKDLPKK
ncbi:rod-binding protein [Candidatus Latescibacterota bacterium]